MYFADLIYAYVQVFWKKTFFNKYIKSLTSHLYIFFPSWKDKMCRFKVSARG